jgi:hypothetical protein
MYLCSRRCRAAVMHLCSRRVEQRSCICVVEGVEQRSCICVVEGVDFASFYDLCNSLWNCSDIVVLLFYFILFRYCDIVFLLYTVPIL